MKKKTFFFLFPTVFMFDFRKNMNPVFSRPRFWLINYDVNNEHKPIRKKLQKQSFADIIQSRCC